MAEMVEVPAQSTTTHEQDRHSLGQRRVNIIWETTQSMIAGSVVLCVLYVSSSMVIAALTTAATSSQIANAQTAFIFLSNIASLVIGFYFGRTNHQRVGGVDLGR